MPSGESDRKFLAINDVDGILIVAVTSSRLSDEENIEEFASELFAAIESRTTAVESSSLRVILDLASVEFASSSALGKIIMLHRRLRRRDGQLVLCNITAGIAELLKGSRLVDYFDVADDVASGVRRLQNGDQSESAAPA